MRAQSPLVHQTTHQIQGREVRLPLQVRDATTGSNAFIYHGYDNQVNVLAWSPDSKRIVLAGLDSTVQVWQSA